MIKRGHFTRRNPAVTDDASLSLTDWIPCYCCGRIYVASNMVRFNRHREDGLCVDCADLLYRCSRPIARRLYPILQLSARIRTRTAPVR